MTDDLVPASRCAWCSAAAPIDATQCPACGAALAQRESIGGLVIAGVTAVDPALQAIDGRPMRISGPSPTQGMAGGVAVAATLGGPVALAALGGIVALAAAEYAGASVGRPGGGGGAVDVATLGNPSEVALQALDRLDHAGVGASPDDSDPWRDEPGRLNPSAPAP